MKSDNISLKCACDISESHFIEDILLYYDDKPEIKYSRKFNKKMKKLCKETEGALYKSKHAGSILKIFLIAAVLIVLFSVTVIAIAPIREGIKNFVINRNSNSSEIVFSIDNSNYGTLYRNYSWMPDCYELYEKKNDKFGEFITYKDEYGHSICCMSEKNNGNEGIFINTEGVETEEININGVIGIYFENRGMRSVLWSQGNFNYYIDAESSFVSKEELLKIAENRKNK